MLKHTLIALIWIGVLVFVGTYVSEVVPPQQVVECDTDSDCQQKNGGNGDPE